MWGPGQDIILGKMGGKAMRTNVAGGMSGSPVYIDGKLIGAVALRLSVFSPDAICGITPIELMLEINEFDQSRPADARTPRRSPSAVGRAAWSRVPGESAGDRSVCGRRLRFPAPPAPHDGAHRDAADLLRLQRRRSARSSQPLFNQLGITAVQGGAGIGARFQQARRRLGARACSPDKPSRACWSPAT